MAILTGRYGSVMYTPGTPPGGVEAEIISLNAWKADFSADYEDVTCFGDTNKVFVPGLPNVSGTVSGFWNSAELALFHAAVATVPGTLKLTPNKNEATFFWTGLAYLDASIDCTLAVPKVTGNFKAAGPWVGPDGGTL